MEGVITEPPPTRLWCAYDHQGKSALIHKLCGNTETHCNRLIQDMPGVFNFGDPDQVTCKECIASMIDCKEATVKMVRASRATAQADQYKGRESERWREEYTRYLQSPEWLEKRRRVMSRCNGICEGCGEANAVQVHHRWYPPRPILPGSREWIRAEKLFHLVAVCMRCHNDLHPNKPPL
jgi:hypothetical protein